MIVNLMNDETFTIQFYTQEARKEFFEKFGGKQELDRLMEVVR